MVRKAPERFREIPNVGPAIEQHFDALGLKHPSQLAELDPYRMYDDLCRLTHSRIDPCVLDVFISAVRFMQGGPARRWWEFTAERKKRLAAKSAR